MSRSVDKSADNKSVSAIGLVALVTKEPGFWAKTAIEVEGSAFNAKPSDLIP